jgi:arabinofuranosyltransferase
VKRSGWLLAAIVAAAILIAWLIRFGTDDAYITFIYSRNLVRGDGLTWFGESIEGYTNFAWALWIALGLRLGMDPLHWAWVGSLASLGATLVIAFRLADVLLASRRAAFWVSAVLATNFTFLAFGTSGLETMLQTALVTSAVLQLERMRAGASPTTPLRLAAVALTCSVAVLTRLDSAVICAPLAVALMRMLVRQAAPLKAWVSATGPVIVLVGSWLVWKFFYYGHLVPNTFFAKVGLSWPTIENGLRYAIGFGHAYLIWPFLLVALIALRWRRPRSWLPHIIVLTWLVYVIAVGGDFMEFRFFVPVLPLAIIIIADVFTAEVTNVSIPKPWLRATASLALLAALSWRHAAKFRGAPDLSYDAVRSMGRYYGIVPDGDWGRIGGVLHETLAGTGASIAINGAGAIPYFADVPTIDQLGLNDAWVARHGIRPPRSYARPGHQRFATYDYLVRRNVTFVIGSPTIIPRGALSAAHLTFPRKGWLFAFLGYAYQQVPSFVLTAAPLTDESALLLWYLTPSREVTERVQKAGWEIRDLTGK